MLEAEIGALLLVRIVANLRGDVTFLVQNGHPALQFRKDSIIATDVNGCWHPQIFLDDLHEIPIEVPVAADWKTVVEQWLESQGRTPAEMSLKSRLRDLVKRPSGKM